MKFLSFGLAAGALGVLAGCANYPGNVTALHPVIHTDPSLVDDTAPPAIRELSFDSHGKRLNGLIYLANGPGPHPTVVLLHGYPGNEKNLDLAQSLRRASWVCMARPSEPSPPAVETAIASAGVDALAIGA